MPRIPTYSAQQSYRVVPAPKVTPQHMGSGLGVGLSTVGQQGVELGKAELAIAEKTASDTYVSKAASEARAIWTKRVIDLGRTDEDMAPVLNAEMEKYIKDSLSNAPNRDAANRAGLALRTMSNTFNSQALLGDEERRVKRRIAQSDATHSNHQSAVYDDFGQLQTILAASVAEVNSLAGIPDSQKAAILISRRYDIGYQGLHGLIDRDETGAAQALSILTDPNFEELVNTLIPVEKKSSLIKYANQALRQYRSDASADLLREKRQYDMDQRDELTRVYEMWEDGLFTEQNLRDSILDTKHKNLFREAVNKDAAGFSQSLQAKTEKWTELYTEALRSDPDSYYEFMNEQVMPAFSDRLIDHEDLKFFEKLADEERTEAKKSYLKMMQSIASRTNPMTGARDPKGDLNWHRALIFIQDYVSDAKDRGIAEYELFSYSEDPTSEFQMMDKQVRDIVVRSTSEQLADQMAAMTETLRDLEALEGEDKVDRRGWIEALRNTLDEYLAR